MDAQSVDVLELFQRLAVALAIGLLVGLERGWKTREEAEGERAAGLRTFALAGLLGGVSAALASLTAPVTLGLFALAFTAVFIVFHWLQAEREKDLSATGVVAGILTFALGAYAMLGSLVVAAAAAVTMTLLLALKQPLHRWIAKLTWAELRAALTLLAMTFLLLPILPDKPVDPWGVLVPSQIWLYAILVAAVSFAGYVAIRVAGERTGVMLAAVAGGLASSTATTLTLARLGRGEAGEASILAGGILLACAVMAARIVVIAAIVNPAILPPLGIPLAAATLAFALVGYLLARRGAGKEAPTIALDNPFDLGTALKLAALIAAVMLVAAVVTRFAGDAGLWVVAAVSGLADVDAITLSLARMAQTDITPQVAALGIAIAAAVNSLVKVGLVFATGTMATGRLVALGTAAAFVAAGAAFAVVVPLLAG